MKNVTDTSIIMTAYPLSASFESKVCKLLGGSAQTVSVAQLRSQGIGGLIRQLWSMRVSTLALPIEEENATALLPVLKLLAAFTRSQSICIVHPDLRYVAVSRWQIALDGLHFLSASISCLWTAYRANRELTALLQKTRVAARTFATTGSVLYLKTNLWFGIKAGGSVGHIAGVINGLHRLGYRVTFASAEPPVMLDSGIKFLPVKPPTAFGMPYELNNYRFQESFLNAMESYKGIPSVNLIYQRLSAANYLGVILSRHYRLPLVVEYNGSEVWVAKHWGRGMRFQKLAEMAEDAMLRHAHLIVTVSEALKADLIERGVEANRIVMYPNCIDPCIYNSDRYSADELQNLRKTLEIPDDSVLVTFVGTFGQWHGAEKLAEAIAYLWETKKYKLPTEKLHFLLVGDGLTKQTVERIVNEAGADEICTFTGLIPQSETPKYLAASDILVSPHVQNPDGTKFFGSPTKLFEYMAVGKAIIASDLEQIGEILRNSIRIDSQETEEEISKNGRVALLVAPSDANELSAAIVKVAENRLLMNALGDNAKKLAIEKYTWATHVKKIVEKLGG